MKKNYFKGLSILFLSLFVSVTTYAQLGTDVYTLGADNANNYAGTWNETTAGTGFSDWVFDTATPNGGFAGRFLGSFSAALDVTSNSFGLFANSGNNATSGATRSLPQTLQEGDVFTISIGVNFRDGAKGFDLRDASNATILNFNVGSDKYTMDGSTDLFGDAYDANTVITFTFTQNATSLDWTAVRSGGSTGTQSGTKNTVNAGTITNLRLYNVSSGTANDGGAGERNLYFNSFEFTSLYSINNNSSVTVSSNTTAPYLTIESGSSLTVNSNIDLNISGNLSNSGTLTANAGSSLRVAGTSTGEVTYNRTLTFVSGNTNGWHLVSSPVAGETFDNTFATNNDVASSGTNLGVATYNTTGNTWSYLQSPSGSISSTSGMGYSIKRASTGTVSFTGTINTEDVNGVSVGTADGGFNLLGNPYTAYMSSQTFLDANTNTTGQIWTWTHGGGYTARTAEDNFIIAPGQGFFVSVASGTTVDFAESNQSSGTDNFQKTDKTEISLSIANGKLNRSARLLYFDENVTKGFDWGYEGKTFTAIKSGMEVYTHMLENNIGEKYQVQSLPKNEMESYVIPVGITADAGEITFSAEAINLPSGLKVFLEDRTTNTFTRLDEANASYKVTLTEKTDAIGRFYLHTKSSALSTTDVTLENISIYPTNKSTLRIVGLSQGKSTVKLFNTLGKQVLYTSFTSTGVYDLNLPKLATGLYIVQLENETGTLNKKIVLE